MMETREDLQKGTAGPIPALAAVIQPQNETRTGEALNTGKRASVDTNQPADVAAEELSKAWSRKERAALIELLIDSLDEEADDADLEPSLGFLEPDLTSSDNGYTDDARQDIPQGSTSDGEDGGDDEPSLGFQAGDLFVGRGCQHVHPGDDREVENEHDEPSGDENEPSLGSLSSCYGGGDQTSWGHGGANDFEEEHDGREPDDDQGGEGWLEDCEPSLGWTDTEAARGRYTNWGERSFDLEEQCEDEGDRSDTGIGDADGLLEQVAGIPGCYTGFGRGAL
jgi:hypothetical protein